MGTITTGIGLMSGIDTGQLIEALIALESRSKSSLQNRIAIIGAQRSALLDINARLLNLKTAARAFRLDKVFQSTLASTTDDTVLTASADKTAQPGTYQFIVKQLVSTSQKLSQGFVDSNTTPLGLTSLSLEFGRGNLAADRDLQQLNGGGGVDRGRIVITDRSGAQATINLTDVTTLNEALDRINSATGVSIHAGVDGDHLVITDTSGGAGTLTVANAAGDTTASDLGIAGSIAGNVLTGSNINTLGVQSALAALNDGNGVLTRNNVSDFTITARDGSLLSIDLGRIDLDIDGNTLLTALNNGAGVTIDNDHDTPEIEFIARDGTSYEVNLTGITTVGGLITRVANETGGHIQISVHANGDRLTVTDTVGGTGNLRVLGAGANGTAAANDLGILNESGGAADSFNGSIIPNTISDPPATTLGAVINRINNAAGNGGKIVASLAPDGVSLLITDTTGGGGNLIIRRTVSNAHAAANLGIETDVAGVASNTHDGQRLVSSLGSVLVRNLNGGSGLNGATTLTVTDRSGASLTLNNLNTFDSLSDIINEINTQAAAQIPPVQITASLNSAGNGLKITDDSGGAGNLTISGDAADALGIAADVASTAVRGSNLQLRYVSEATKLSDLNYGRGIGLGRFRITDGLGASAIVDIGADSLTLHDVIEEINSRGLAIRARINDNGDGLLIESDLEVGQNPVVKIKVETVSGSTAKDLNILGSSSTVENATIDGSYERTISVSANQNLAQIAAAINAAASGGSSGGGGGGGAGVPVSASIINTGSGAAPYRLSITSGISGRAGEMIIDTGEVDLGFTTLTKGADAKILFGSSNPEDAFLITSTSNTVKNVVQGLTLELKSASDEAVTVTVSRDDETILAAVKRFVTNFNDVIGRINQYDFYNVDTQTRGPLLGNPTTARVRESMHRMVQARAVGVDTQYQYLRDIGIRIGAKGEVKFDEAKFTAAYESDPQAVEQLFAAFESTSAGSEEIAPGVTIPTQPTETVRGFGELFGDLMNSFTDSINGVVTLADKNFQNQVEAANKRIAEMNKRLDAKRARLQAEFAGMEAALARLQGQSTALGSLANNMLLAQNMLTRRS